LKQKKSTSVPCGSKQSGHVKQNKPKNNLNFQFSSPQQPGDDESEESFEFECIDDCIDHLRTVRDCQNCMTKPCRKCRAAEMRFDASIRKLSTIEGFDCDAYREYLQI
jgi:hypothetical protein